MNLVIIVVSIQVLIIAAATGIVAVYEGRWWLYWRKRALAAEKDADGARRYANEAHNQIEHWMKQAYATTGIPVVARKVHAPTRSRTVPTVTSAGHRPAHRKEKIR